jgi:hypothetical protein
MSPRRLISLFTPALCCCATLAGCGSTSDRAPEHDPEIVHWTGFEHVHRVVDLSAPRSDGSIVVATDGHLALLTSNGALRPFAPGYRAPVGLEPYIALATGCFGHDDLYALRLGGPRGITKITANGHAALFVRLPGQGLLDGIAVDGTGDFGRRLLVTSTANGTTTVDAIDCRGRVQILTRTAPRVEGGVSVAPATFGAFAGDLIAPEEQSGNLYALAPDGRTTLIARSGIPHGQDIGIESTGFVPTGYGQALVSDRLTPGNRHPGDDLILALTHATLAGLGVHGGDLVVVGEGGANTIVVSCTATCRARRIATGPTVAHIEGHVVFSRP